MSKNKSELRKFKTAINTWIRQKRHRTYPENVLQKELNSLGETFSSFVNQLGLIELVSKLGDAQMVFVLPWILQYFKIRLTFPDTEQETLSDKQKEMQEETVCSIEEIIGALTHDPLDGLLIRKKIEYLQELENEYYLNETEDTNGESNENISPQDNQDI